MEERTARHAPMVFPFSISRSSSVTRVCDRGFVQSFPVEEVGHQGFPVAWHPLLAVVGVLCNLLRGMACGLRACYILENPSYFI